MCLYRLLPRSGAVYHGHTDTTELGQAINDGECCRSIPVRDADRSP